MRGAGAEKTTYIGGGKRTTPPGVERVRRASGRGYGQRIFLDPRKQRLVFIALPQPLPPVFAPSASTTYNRLARPPHHVFTLPPSTASVCPVTKSLSAEVR